MGFVALRAPGRGKCPVSAVGVVVALAGEAQALTARHCAAGESVALPDGTLIRLGGVGSGRAARAASALIEAGAGALVSWGIAGGLDPDLRPGDVVLPQAVEGIGRTTFEVDANWRARLREHIGDRVPVHGGTLVQSDRPLRDRASKRAAFESTGACAVDMESVAIAACARRAGVPFLAVRCVSDSAEIPIPTGALIGIDAEGNKHCAAVALWLLRHPAQLPGMLHLRRSYRAALSSLRAVAKTAGPSLCGRELG